MDRPERIRFFASYGALVLGCVVVSPAIVFLSGPARFAAAIESFGQPPIALLVVFSVVVAVLGFAGHYLFAILEGPRAAYTQRLVMVGFFVAAALGLGPLRRQILDDPSSFLWTTAIVVYSAAALLCVRHVARAESDPRGVPTVGWFLPSGFWSAMLYAHLATIVNFVYLSLPSVIVMFGMDKASLGYLTAPMRYQVLMKIVPDFTASVLAPGLSKLDSVGMRARALAQGSAAISASMVLVAPASLALILFAGDAMAVFGPEFSEHRDLLRILAVSFMAGPVVYLSGGVMTALGAFRGYLIVSVVYVLAAVALLAGLVPLLGLEGAALAASLGVFVRQVVTAAVMRRLLGFRMPARVWAGWGWAALAAIVAWTSEPGRLASAGWFLAIGAAFTWTAGITPHEIRRLVRLALGRSEG